MRAFYRMKKSHFRERGEKTMRPENYGAVVLYVGREFVYLHVADDSVMPRGAERLADTWAGLKEALTVTQRGKVFRKVVLRTVKEDGKQVERHMLVEQGDRNPANRVKVRRRRATLWVATPEPADEVLNEWIVPHKFLGDEKQDPVV